MFCDDCCSDTCRVVFCYITLFKNAAKESLPCPDNTNKFILFWVKLSIYLPHKSGRYSNYFPVDIEMIGIKMVGIENVSLQNLLNAIATPTEDCFG